MYYVTKRSKEMCIGHRLIGAAPSKCKNVHGHGIIVELVFQSTPGPNGIGVDFFDIADFLSEIDRDWDHGFLVNWQDETMLNFLRGCESKHCEIHGNPTMEQLCSEVVVRMHKDNPKLYTKLRRVSIYEKGGIDNVATLDIQE